MASGSHSGGLIPCAARPARALTRAAAALALAAGLVLGAGGTGRAEEKSEPLRFDLASLVARPDPLIVGAGVHFGIGGKYNYDPEKTAKLVREMGFTSVRDDLVWPTFIRPYAHPNASPPPQAWRLQRFLAMAQVQPLLILGHAHPNIPGGIPPMTAEGRDAFADFAVKTADFVRRFNPMFEIWNEWNVDGQFNPPWLTGPGQPGDPRSPADYLKLVETVKPVLNRVLPKSPVLIGTSGFDPDWTWTRSVFGGSLRGAQGLSVHLSNHCDPTIHKRSATEAIDRVGVLQALIGKPDAQVPIYVSEVGWPTAPLSPCVISREQQADYLAQFLFWAAATPWLKGAWVYEFKDQGSHLENIEHNFGMFTFDYEPKPAACAVRETLQLLKGATAFKVERPFQDVFVVQIGGTQGPDKMRLVAWTTGERVRARLVPGDGVKVDARLLCSAPQPEGAGGYSLGPQPLVMDVSGTTAGFEAILTR